MTDIYRWWSKKALKREISKLKLTYNELFDDMLKTQEENRELKKYIKMCNEANDDLQSNNKSLRKQLNDFGYTKLEKLEEAKEIIERLMDIINHDLRCFDTIAGLNVKQKAEQFLKEV